MRILLIDNSKSVNAENTPLLKRILQQHGNTRTCSGFEDVTEALGESWDAIVLSGSSMNVTEKIRPQSIAKDITALVRFQDVAVLGVCFGMQLMAIAYGGKVERLSEKRAGALRTTLCKGACGASTLVSQLYVRPNAPSCVRKWSSEGSATTWYSHQDVVTTVPAGFKQTAVTQDGFVAAMESRALRRYGVQFHPERSCEAGVRVIRRFLAIAAEGRHQIPHRNRFSALDGVRSTTTVTTRKTAPEREEVTGCDEGREQAWEDYVGTPTLDSGRTMTISTEKWNRIALRMGRANHAIVSEEEGVPPSVVLMIWEEFRTRFRIPPMLV